MFNLEQFNDIEKFLTWARTQSGEVNLKSSQYCPMAEWATECGARKAESAYVRLYENGFPNESYAHELPDWGRWFLARVKTGKIYHRVQWYEVCAAIEKYL